jgi:hypothetical protein
VVDAATVSRGTVQGVRSYGGHFIRAHFTINPLRSSNHVLASQSLPAFANCSQRIPPEQSRRPSISPVQTSIVAETEAENREMPGLVGHVMKAEAEVS